MNAVLLIGGRGTRLRTLYPDRPKALVPVAGRPFLEWQLEWLARGGVRQVHLAAGHLAEAVQAWLRTRGAPRLRLGDHVCAVSFSAEPEPLGTAGGLRFAAETVAGDPLLVCNGDSLLPHLDFQGLEKCHRQFSKGWKKRRPDFQGLEKSRKKIPNLGTSASLPPLATLAVTRIEEAGRYGTVEFDADGLITAFREKADRRAGWVNGGVYVINRAVVGLIERGRPLSLETDVFPALAREGRLKAFPCDPPLLDMGTPEGLRATEAWLRAHARPGRGKPAPRGSIAGWKAER